MQLLIIKVPLKKLNDEVLNLTKQNKDLANQIEDNKKILQNIQNDIKEYELSNFSLKNEFDKVSMNLENALKDKEEIASQVENQSKIFVSTKKNFESSIESLKNELCLKSHENEKSVKQVEELLKHKMDFEHELSELKFNSIYDMEKKIKDMQEVFDKIIQRKENESEAKLVNWQIEEANLLKQINKLSIENDIISKALAKSKEENKELELSRKSLRLQVNEFEQLYENTKLQVNDVVNNLILAKVQNQKQLDALSLQIVMLNQKVFNVSSEKNHLLKENNNLKDDNVLQRETIQKSEDRRRKESQDIRTPLLYLQEIFNTNTINFILMNMLVAFQIVYLNKNKESKKYTNNSMTLFLNKQNDYEKEVKNHQYFVMIKKINMPKNIQHIENLSILLNLNGSFNVTSNKDLSKQKENFFEIVTIKDKISGLINEVIYFKEVVTLITTTLKDLIVNKNICIFKQNQQIVNFNINKKQTSENIIIENNVENNSKNMVCEENKFGGHGAHKQKYNKNNNQVIISKNFYIRIILIVWDRGK